jgi:hypothetical protein
MIALAAAAFPKHDYVVVHADQAVLDCVTEFAIDGENESTTWTDALATLPLS